MQNYHPIRYVDVRAEVDSTKESINAELAMLADELGAESDAFRSEADRLLGADIVSGDHFLASLRRLMIMDGDHDRWVQGGRVLFDMDQLSGCEAFDWDDVNLMEFEIPEQNFYLHLGSGDAIRLVADPSLSFEGIYINASSLDGKDGFDVTFVCVSDEPASNTTYSSKLATAARIAYSWVPFDAPISASIKERGVAGDPLLLNDPSLMVLIDGLSEMIGRLCAAERSMKYANPSMRH